MSEIVEVLLNSRVISRVSVNSPQKVMGEIFAPLYWQAKYMSNDALSNMIEKSAEAIFELTPNIKTSRLMKYSEKVAKKSRESMLGFITNSVLASEGLPLLHGFGAAKKAAKGSQYYVNSNPETSSINAL